MISKCISSFPQIYIINSVDRTTLSCKHPPHPPPLSPPLSTDAARGLPPLIMIYDDFCSAATEEPVIAEPHICGGFPIDETFHCLVLMSDGVYKSIDEASDVETNSNFDVVRLVAEELHCQNNMTGVAQAVVDRVGRAHHDTYMTQMSKCQKRDDMTLLIRIFKEEIANSLKSPRAPGRQSVSGRYATLSGIHWKLRLRIDCRRPEFPCGHQQATDLKSCQCSSCQPVPGFQRVKWSEVADGEKKPREVWVGSSKVRVHHATQPNPPSSFHSSTTVAPFTITLRHAERLEQAIFLQINARQTMRPLFFCCALLHLAGQEIQSNLPLRPPLESDPSCLRPLFQTTKSFRVKFL